VNCPICEKRGDYSRLNWVASACYVECPECNSSWSADEQVLIKATIEANKDDDD
jgi:hypothetical protein